MFRLSEKGNSVVSGLAASAFTSVAIFASLKLLGTSQRIDRGIAANTELTELRDSLNQYLADTVTCRQTLIHQPPNELIVDPDHADLTPVVVTLPGTGSPTAFIEADSVSQGGRRITGLSFSSPLTRLDVPPLPPNMEGSPPQPVPLYFAVLNLKTEEAGKGLSHRNGNLGVYVKLAIEPITNKVKNCYQSNTISALPGQTCPAGRVLTGIEADGTIRCGTDESTPDIVSDWVTPQTAPLGQTVKIDFSHSLGTTEYRVAPEIIAERTPAGLLNWNRCDHNHGCPAGMLFIGFVQGCTQPTNASLTCNNSQCGLCAISLTSNTGSQAILTGGGVVTSIRESNVIWTNKQENSIDVRWVGDQWNAGVLTPWPSNPNARWMRVRVFKYPSN